MSAGVKTREKRERKLTSSVAAVLASKKRRPNTPSTASDTAVLVESEVELCGAPTIGTTAAHHVESRVAVFKDHVFVNSSKDVCDGKKKAWKTARQIIAAEKSNTTNHVTYGVIDAPPSFIPAKKYCDITGLQAKYTDPHTKLRYARAEDYSRIRMLPSDIVSGLLALRKASVVVP